MIEKGQKLTVLQEKIYDVGTFMGVHPGGAFVMSCMVGLDCTTFYVGSSTITTDSKSFKHPPTVQTTLDRLFVGFLGDEDSILKEKHNSGENEDS